MSPVMEFGPVVICNCVSAIDDDGSPPALLGPTEAALRRVSMVSARAADAGELFPAVSVRVAVTFHTPSVKVGSVQLVADPIT
jgi:hypothetical protein